MLTCFKKSRHCLCHRPKINTQVSYHSAVVHSAIILQTEWFAGTQRSLAVIRLHLQWLNFTHKHTYTRVHTHPHRRTHFFTRICLTFPWHFTFTLESDMAFTGWLFSGTKEVYVLGGLLETKKNKTFKNKNIEGFWSRVLAQDSLSQGRWWMRHWLKDGQLTRTDNIKRYLKWRSLHIAVWREKKKEWMWLCPRMIGPVAVNINFCSVAHWGDWSVGRMVIGA